MPTTAFVAVSELLLDKKNFRTVTQKNEEGCLRALVSIDPHKFWGLTTSLLDDGYLNNESVIVLKSGKKFDLVVKEGNRRVAALKLILGLLRAENFEVPNDIGDRVSKLSASWKTESSKVPCTIYEASESTKVDRIVSLTHGKAQAAARDPWGSLARARHNREMNHASEPGLDLLERYLRSGTNISPEQAERWAGDYPVTVLDEAAALVAPRLKLTSARDLAGKYPNLPYRHQLERLIHAIGLQMVRFPDLRGTIDILADKYGFPALSAAPAGSGSGAGGTSPKKPKPKKKGRVSIPINDPRSVMRTLRAFAPHGKNRDKVATLLEEARSLNLYKTPLAFCFILRSAFELSAKAYCKDHGISISKPEGTDRKLLDILIDIHKHMTPKGTDPTTIKDLHGAMSEIRTPTGFLSVTSLNQLIHNPKFSVDASHISTVFFNVFPLL